MRVRLRVGLLFCLFSFFAGPSFAVDVARTSGTTGDEVIVDCLEGILILGNWGEVRKQTVDEFDGIEIEGVQLLRQHPNFVRTLYNRYVGKPLTQRLIWEIKRDIAHFYRSKNQPSVTLTIPRQNVSNGILQIVVEEAKLGKVTVQGNCYFPIRWFSDAMRSIPGEPIDAQTVLEDVAWLNLNPFRRTDARYKPGDKPGVADIELITIDRWPARLYLGGDNTGTISTDRNRMFFGFNFGKSVLKDGQISYQFTFAPNWNRFYSHTASARLPLPWRHVWVLWGGYSQVEPTTSLAGMKNHGVSWQVATRYRIPIFSSLGLLQTFVLGYDFKETDNDMYLRSVKIFNVDADINQFMLGYELGFRGEKVRVALNTEVYGNPGGITHANNNHAYEFLRYDAHSEYVYLKLAHSLAWRFCAGWFSYDLRGQIASTNLLPSEQFTMTGHEAVRGFEERILNLDNAFIGTLTYETPHWSLAKAFGWNRKYDEFYLLAFFDGGCGGNHNPSIGESSFQNLASVGPGVRWQIDRYFTARFDYGFQLWHSGFDHISDSRYNFGMMLSY